MKNYSNLGSIFLLLLIFLLAGVHSSFAQDVEKSKVRLNATYVKIMDGESFIEVKATAKIDKKNESVSGVKINIYNDLVEDRVDLGSIVTNEDGKGTFSLGSIKNIVPDSTNTYNITISFKGNETLTRAKKQVSFKDVKIVADMVTKDSINYIEARLSDPITDSAFVEMPLRINLQRMFRPLRVGEEYYETDENGTIFVEIEEKFPGVDGNLVYEVVLFESEDYGTVKDLIKTDTGIPIVDESTFDDKTMWSPRDKTPLFMLIFPNLLLIIIWGLIVYLIFNLFKITKA